MADTEKDASIKARLKGSFEYGRRIGWNEARALIIERLAEYGKDSLVCKALAELIELAVEDR